jgi:hypothetical protein
MENINIPARLSFRPLRSSWEIAFAETVGWFHDENAHIFRSFRGPSDVSIEQVRIKVAVPVEQNDSPGDDDGSYLHQLMRMPYYSHFSVALYRSDVPETVLPRSESSSNSSDIAGRRFEILACIDGEKGSPMPSFEPEGPEKDAWRMRNDFLHLDQDVDALRGFLNRWGQWDNREGYSLGIFEKKLPLLLVSPEKVWQEQGRLRMALTSSPREWLRSRQQLRLSAGGEPPYFTVKHFYCLDAIKATITTDHLSKARFGICKRHDCRSLFQCESGHKRLYCSPQCAHLANVRKLRAKKKKTATKVRKDATRKS